jgi:cytidine deaminase
MTPGELIDRARSARENAYCPYSGYAVGAAVLGADGEVYVGCNVENVAYSPTLCAERAAIAAMVVAGCRETAEVAIVTADGGMPCGVCRQTLLEFAPDPAMVSVHAAGDDGSYRTVSLAELMPYPFQSENVT